MGAQASKPDPIGDTLRAVDDLSSSNFPNYLGRTVDLPPANPDLPPRTIGYALYGDTSDSAAHTLIFFHGTPGTRFFFTTPHSAAALAHSVRVVVPERPGYGLSSPAKGRTLRDSATDVAALLDALEVKQPVAVVGYSAGGPFALAFAHDFPERCSAVAVVSSLSPNARGVTEGMTSLSRLGYLLATHAPSLLYFLVRALAPAAQRGAFDATRDDFTTDENAFFASRDDVRRVFAKCTLELYSRTCGAAAEAEDYALMANDWGFKLEDIMGEFGIWVYAGAQDNKCTEGMFRTLVSRLPQRRLRKVFSEEENHLYFYKLFDHRLLSDLGLVKVMGT